MKKIPRKARNKSKSGIYHVMIRGNERKNIFFDDEDRIKFISILEEKQNDNNFSLYAYCLMDNHVHLIIQEKIDDISKIMKKINTSYAYYFNKKHNRIGHVFQDRFKSEAIEDESYLLAALRYVHNNPVKANIVQSPLDYKWSSYKLYLTKDKSKKCLIAKNFILELFSPNKEKAIKMLIEFMNQFAEDNFIDDEEVDKKKLLDEKDSKIFIQNYLKEKGLQLKELNKKSNISHRNELIKKLKINSKLSVREISRILGISKDIIYRV